MKTPTPLLATLIALFTAANAFASGGEAVSLEQIKPDLKECELYKTDPQKRKGMKKMDEVFEDTHKWALAKKIFDDEKNAFLVICQEVKAAPNAPGAMQKFSTKRDQVLKKYREFDNSKKLAKKKYEKVYKPLKELDDVVCHEKVRKGHEKLEKVTIDEYNDLSNKLETVCKIIPLGSVAQGR